MTSKLSVPIAALALFLAACGRGPLDEGGQLLTLDIAEATVPCVGVGPGTCMLVRAHPDSAFEYMYESIDGFAYEAGFRYRVNVRRTSVANPPADGSAYRYSLARVVSRERSPHFELLARLRAAEQRWEANQPLRYRMTGQRDCFCPEEWRGPVVLEVVRAQRGSGMEEIRRATYASSGAELSAEIREVFHPVQGLFTLLRQAIVQNAYSIEAEFDATLGYPKRIWIDYNAQMADEETGYTVTSVTPL